MVKDTREKVLASAFKPVNTPEPAAVKEDPLGRPVAIKAGKEQKIIAIDDCWRLDDEWWRRAPVSRLYYSVSLITGQRLVVFKDIIANRWFRQSY